MIKQVSKLTKEGGSTMTRKKHSICLNMIVKNESKVITRCLDSVKDLIDYWVISDTGSTDGTQNIIRNYFKQHHIKGELHEHAWQDFAHNRNLALKAARGKTDYILIMDADDYFIKEDTFRLPPLKAGCYALKTRRKGITYYCDKLIRSSLPWRWKGVLHEHLYCSINYTIDKIADGCELQSTAEGARSQNPHKYWDDAMVLEKGVLAEPNNTRYRFYLAQSYRDAGFPEKALENYQKRAEMGGWAEEVYYALLEVGHHKQRLNHSARDVIDAYLKAYHYRPQRLEALYYAITLCRIHAHFHLGYQLGWAATDVLFPADDVLFVDTSVYDWRFLDELSICAINANKPQEGVRMIEALLHSERVPIDQKDRIIANLNYARSLTSAI
jgi:glycosyltransferase involved in cell wall biosynthesis